MLLNLETFRDKLAGCWAGKNIGGVLGTPYENIRKINEVDFYTQDLSKGAPANDDLDLQIIWLSAVEKFGRNVNASILGDYWLTFVLPNWVEYGTGKANLRAGLVPPLSGEVDNVYKNSCGCYIRSEIWACLAPGHPELAARYAYEDAIVDHAGEGVYGEIFYAALESAAFVESDIRKLINIGLSYIPKECATAKAVKKAVECYDNQVDFYEARKQIHNTAPGTIGLEGWKLSEVPVEGNEGMVHGQPGFDAPENVAFSIAGWLYGEGDFGRSLCLTNALGEDADCTCATLGAIMGIILGASGLPEKWTKPLNDKIVTMCINKTNRGVWVPDTATELAERILRNVPSFLGHELCDIFADGGMTITCKEGEELYCDTTVEYLPFINACGRKHELSVLDLCELSPYTVRYEFPLFRVMLDYNGSVYFKKGENKKIGIKIVTSDLMGEQQWLRVTAYMPSGVEVCGSKSVELQLNNLIGSYAETELEICTDSFEGSRLEFIIDISLMGRHSSGSMKVTLLYCGK